MFLLVSLLLVGKLSAAIQAACLAQYLAIGLYFLYLGSSVHVNLQQHKPLVPDVTRDLGTIQWLKKTEKARIEVGKPYNPVDRRTVRVLLVADGCRN